MRRVVFIITIIFFLNKRPVLRKIDSGVRQLRVCVRTRADVGIRPRAVFNIVDVKSEYFRRYLETTVDDIKNVIIYLVQIRIPEVFHVVVHERVEF